MLHRIIQALGGIRAPLTQDEYDLHAMVRKALAQAGIPALHEAPLMPRCRVDFLCDTVGIEIKRGKPAKISLRAQVERYLSCDKLTALVLVSERGVDLPAEVAGKPVAQVSLARLWGVAVVTALETAPLPPQPEDAPVQTLCGEADAQQALPAQADEADLPDYLRSPSAHAHTYGTLRYNARAKCWTIKGEPCVIEMAKRLFPGTSVNRRGEARFAAHRRIVGDANWLMLRYPLNVHPADEARWAQAMSEARQYAVLREQAQQLTPVTPPDSAFCGALRPFQQLGLSWLCLTKRALLADEMGLGKTVQALAALATLRTYPAIIVVPPHLVRNWQAEISRFLRVDGASARVHVIKGLKPLPLPQADVYIMHYLLLRGWKHVLPALGFRMVIFDEAQELRHTGTEKYSAASLLAESSDRVIGLSGTPIYNQGGEIWNVVNILDFHFLGDYDSFTREWCYGYGNNVVIRPEQLGEHLRREGLMLRRTKADVLPELPAKRRLVQEIDTDDVVYQRLMKPVLDKLSLWQRDDTLSPQARSILEEQISQGQRQATGLAKAPYVCQFVRALLEADERVLLFAHHHAVMDAYKQELEAFHPVFITGRETGQRKEDAVQAFMSGQTALCCVSLRAASGLNLQKATCVVFGELDWSPAVHSQAEDRAHRIGQQDSLLCYYLVSPRGSDADMQEALGLKVSQFMGLMGDTPQSPLAQAQDAHIARRHVEKLVQRACGGETAANGASSISGGGVL